MLAAANRSGSNISGIDQVPPLPRQGPFDVRGMSSAPGHHGNPHSLPRLATQGHHMHIGGDLRTAPPLHTDSFGFEHNFDGGSTINPAHLHMFESARNPASPFAVTPTSPFGPHPPILEDEENFDWMHGFQTQMSFGSGPGQNVMTSSPEMVQFGHQGVPPPHNHHFDQTANQSGMMWSDGVIQDHGSGSMNMNTVGSTYPPLDPMTQTLNPEALHQNHLPGNMYDQQSTNHAMPGFMYQGSMPEQYVSHPSFSDGTSASSTNGSARQSSVTSVSTDSITEVTRNALILSLSQPSTFGNGHRKYSQPTVSSPLSPHKSTLSSSLPSTYDLQRFVGAYIQFFHPHFPFLHIPTLSFDTAPFTSDMRPASTASNGESQGDIVGGGGCLILAMAAIGALYEFDQPASKDLFEAAKRLIQLYLEERRRADSRSGMGEAAAQATPLWLVQAMLLNVIYGHNCGDKTAGDIASTHCTALVSLARAAELTRPFVKSDSSGFNGDGDVKMEEATGFRDPWISRSHANVDVQAQWCEWITNEERKRTLFGLFHMSSLLTASYNHAPALMNSEIQLELPCEEELWIAPTAHVWATRRASRPDGGVCMPFASALSELLCASQKDTAHQGMAYNRPFGSGMPLEDVPQSDLRPSTFGCLVLINALHNYIWETRQRHAGHKWTTQETESMHAHIEPALRAWQSAWVTNPSHSIARPNPHGLGPLSADSIPLLDLAYVRLFVNLGMSKEAFWRRDFDAMAEELARGTEIIQHADHSSEATNAPNSANDSRNSPEVPNVTSNEHNASIDDSSLMQSPHADISSITSTAPTANAHQSPPTQKPHPTRTDRRERHLRRAAFYAADSLSMSDALGITFADFTSRELPVQSAMCTFDCAQILAEWVATVQERVGSYLGVLGRDVIDYQQVPAIMLLDDEDCKLLARISEILGKAEAKMSGEGGNMGRTGTQQHLMDLSTQEGFGSKILRMYAYMLERAAVWPGKSTFLSCVSYKPSKHIPAEQATDIGHSHSPDGRRSDLPSGPHVAKSRSVHNLNGDDEHLERYLIDCGTARK